MNKNIHALISQKADQIEEDVINTRRYFHMYPELSGEEKETSRFVAEKLNALGIEVQTNIGGYGVVGILNGANQGTTIAWRADMDACAMQEENDKQKYRDEIRKELSRIINEYVKQSKSSVTVDYVKSIPPVYNDETECEEAELILRELIEDSVIPIIDEVPPHGTDDFSCFQNELSGLFFFLGSANLDKGIKARNHTSTFDMDEDCLAFGVKAMSSFLFEILSRR